MEELQAEIAAREEAERKRRIAEDSASFAAMHVSVAEISVSLSCDEVPLRRCPTPCKPPPSNTPRRTPHNAHHAPLASPPPAGLHVRQHVSVAVHSAGARRAQQGPQRGQQDPPDLRIRAADSGRGGEPGGESLMEMNGRERGPRWQLTRAMSAPTCTSSPSPGSRRVPLVRAR